MRVLVGCEFSGRVRDAFTSKGHDAVSCDFLPSDTPGEHWKGDIHTLIRNRDATPCYFPRDSIRRVDINCHWDLMIVFPPCKYICNGGNNWLNRRPDLAWRENREKAAAFFMEFVNADIPKIAIENPIGCMSTKYRKPDQIIRPWMFGDPSNKDVCLWLKGLPKLKATHEYAGPYKHWDVWSTERHKNGRDVKAITFPGIAAAMAEQWGNPSTKGGDR